jgi:hypothetical protein
VRTGEQHEPASSVLNFWRKGRRLEPACQHVSQVGEAKRLNREPVHREIAWPPSTRKGPGAEDPPRVYDAGVKGICLVLATSALFVGCSDTTKPSLPPANDPTVPTLSLSQLYAAPDTLVGLALYEEPFLWRDFMLFNPPEGTPLRAVVFLNDAAPESLLDSVTEVYIWVVKDSSEVWFKTMQFQHVDVQRDGAHNYIAVDGPLWGPGILVDVVIGVRRSGGDLSTILIRAVPIIGTA